MKIVQIKLENGDLWEIPLSVIASNRADYYKQRAIERKKEDFDYQEELDFVMNDDYEGIDWLQNNMNYKDFARYLIIIKDKTEKEPDWMNCDMEIKDA